MLVMHRIYLESGYIQYALTHMFTDVCISVVTIYLNKYNSIPVWVGEALVGFREQHEGA